MEALKPNENPDFQEMKDLVAKLLKTELELNPAENFMAQVYPNRDNLELIEYLLRKNAFFSYDDLDPIGSSSPAGDALSPADAARCLRDYIRTSRFITGLYRAIKKAQEQFPGEKIRILDVGCGPFALLSIATATQFDPGEVEYSLLDVHEQSIDNSQSIISSMEMDDYFDQHICGDAVTINLQDKLRKRPHIIVAEVMNSALMDEPQAAVTKNMVPQLEEGGMIIPQSVTVSASLLTNAQQYKLGEIIELTKENILRLLSQGDSSEKTVTVEHTFPVPAQVSKARIILNTNIQVFGDQNLKLSDCTITRPFPIGLLRKADAGNQIKIKVKFGGDRFDTKFSLE